MSNGIEVYEVNRWQQYLDRFQNWGYTRGWWMVMYFAFVAIISYLGYAVTAMLLSALDILLTHLQLHMEHRRTGHWRLDKEMNALPRWFMRRFGGYPNPKNYVLAALAIIPFVALIINASLAMGTSESLVTVGTIIGMLFVVNIYHIGYLTGDRR